MKRHHSAQLRVGAGQLRMLGCESGVAHLLDEFHLPIQDVVLQEVTELRVCAGRPRAGRSKRAWVRLFSRTVVASMCPECHPTRLGKASAPPGRERATECWFHIFNRF